jgi:uncharacterized C2H2 Zn-finger protein
MKSCETCGMPQNKRPGCSMDCYDITDNVVTFSKWKPIKKQKLSNCEHCANQYKFEYSEICEICDREETSKDNKFIPRVCGNCGWHEKQNKPLTLKKCLSGKSGWINTYDHKEASDFCGWKPVVCKMCDGTKEVCKCHGVARNRCENGYREGKYLKPCPNCHPEVIKQIKYVQHINKFSVLIGDRRDYFDTLEQAKTAIKKSLGIETK